jgi:hypothetical protein
VFTPRLVELRVFLRQEQQLSLASNMAKVLLKKLQLIFGFFLRIQKGPRNLIMSGLDCFGSLAMTEKIVQFWIKTA